MKWDDISRSNRYSERQAQEYMTSIRRKEKRSKLKDVPQMSHS